VAVLTLSAYGPAASGLAQADVAAEDGTSLSRQRSVFLRAEEALRRRDGPLYRSLRARLAGYPLAPYLDHAEIRQNLATADPGSVHEFLARHGGTPLADSLARDWLRLASDRGDSPEVLRTYRPTSDPDLRCRHLSALLQGGVGDALGEMREVWLVGQRLPDSCASVVDSWRAAGGLTDELVRARVALAMSAGQTELARELSRTLPPGETETITAWIALRADPSALPATDALAEDRADTRRIVVDVLERWARRDPDGAAGAWEILRTRYAFPPEDVASVRVAIARALVRKDDARVLDWLTATDLPPGDGQAHEAAVLSALRLGRWASALEWLQRMPTPMRDSDRWRYWKARALAETGDSAGAGSLFADLAPEWSVYGFLASDRLGREYSLHSVPVSAAPGDLARAEALPGVERARELRVLGRSADARREWARLLREQPAELLPALALVAHHWGWHDQAIATLGRARVYGDLEVRFPLAHRGSVTAHAEANGVDPAWAYGVLRQESAFWADARSPAGAIGLMQLLPSTAREVARRLRVRVEDATLLDSDVNIRLGTAYLGRLRDRLGGHLALATAAYNAGPQRVRSWLPLLQELPTDLWVESVPFPESRSYVQKVLAYTVIYRSRLGLSAERLSDRLPAVRPLPVPAP
jgi:soluble lytic murein transglycosylase